MLYTACYLQCFHTLFCLHAHVVMREKNTCHWYSSTSNPARKWSLPHAKMLNNCIHLFPFIFWNLINKIGNKCICGGNPPPIRMLFPPLTTELLAVHRYGTVSVDMEIISIDLFGWWPSISYRTDPSYCWSFCQCERGVCGRDRYRSTLNRICPILCRAGFIFSFYLSLPGPRTRKGYSPLETGGWTVFALAIGKYRRRRHRRNASHGEKIWANKITAVVIVMCACVCVVERATWIITPDQSLSKWSIF